MQVYGSAEALDSDDVATRLAAIDQASEKGARDYALLSVLLQTGRRAAEVAALRWRDVRIQANGRARLTFEHAKGNERLQDDLPQSTTNALLRWLHRWYGPDMGRLTPDAPLWINVAEHSLGQYGEALGVRSLNVICKTWLGTSKVHATRHSFAHNSEKIGLSVSEIQGRLAHKSLATTGRYLASLRRAENRKADELAQLYGIE